MTFLDIYILLKNRSKEHISYFINNYLSGFETASTYYECPQYSDNPDFETDNINEMIDYLLQKNTKYTLYWNNPINNDIVNGMVFFNNDLSITFGLSINPSKEEYYINKLKSDFNSPFTLSIFELMPPLNGQEFIELVSNVKGNK